VEQGVTNFFTTRKFQSVSGFILAQKAAIMQIGGGFLKKKNNNSRSSKVSRFCASEQRSRSITCAKSIRNYFTYVRFSYLKFVTQLVLEAAHYVIS
jgi:hypothetical protein